MLSYLPNTPESLFVLPFLPLCSQLVTLPVNLPILWWYESNWCFCVGCVSWYLATQTQRLKWARHRQCLNPVCVFVTALTQALHAARFAAENRWSRSQEETILFQTSFNLLQDLFFFLACSPEFFFFHLNTLIWPGICSGCGRFEVRCFTLSSKKLLIHVHYQC